MIIPVVDLFAGPGGLSEGFASFQMSHSVKPYKVKLSIEKERFAHETLELRHFFRSFPHREVPDDYYRFVRGEISRHTLFTAFPKEASVASLGAIQATLGETPASEIDKKIFGAVGKSRAWVLAGGPPCQAYSTIGRSANGGLRSDDHRVFLYREFLRVLQVHTPPIFIIENVEGLLSSSLDGRSVFRDMLEQIKSPTIERRNKAGAARPTNRRAQYDIFSLSSRPRGFDQHGDPEFDPRDYLVPSERFGIPQARHRVILLGVRKDLQYDGSHTLSEVESFVPISRVLAGLPRLRSGVSKGQDSKIEWVEAISQALSAKWLFSVESLDEKVGERIRTTAQGAYAPQKDRGSEFVPYAVDIDYMPRWYLDSRIGGALNHSARSHIVEDLHRYLFSACYGKVHRRSPSLSDFPKPLLPKHRNIAFSIGNGHFKDRFHVQLSGNPATTITSHISKDGHYFIHPDPSQCRSLTVREAARIQTFPDNYFFCGPRTHQYTQVGNAVPPLLSRQVARVVYRILLDSRLIER
jgi:DNA (cytosine-5)-methyltransferase 1